MESGAEEEDNRASHGALPRQKKAATVAVANNSELGRILVDGSGRTLYLFEVGKEGSSTCYDKCAQVWPPFTTQGKPTAGQGASADKLGTITRKNGDTQVTYNGHPLYYYASDDQPGEIKGQDLEQFGAEWYVVSPSGNKVEEEEGGGIQYMMVEELDSEKLVACRYVADLCDRLLDVLSEVLGVNQGSYFAAGISVVASLVRVATKVVTSTLLQVKLTNSAPAGVS